MKEFVESSLLQVHWVAVSMQFHWIMLFTLFGLAHNLVDYCQQIGRAGRSGQALCHAILLHYNETSINITKEMTNYAKNVDTCLRTQLFSPFNDDNKIVPSSTPLHACCSNCSNKCKCESDCPIKFNFECEPDENQPILEAPVVREVPDDQAEIVEKELLKYHLQRSLSSQGMFPSGILSGLTHEVIRDIGPFTLH